MKWPVIGLLLMGVIAAISAAVLVGALHAHLTGGNSVAAERYETVLVASRELPAMIRLTRDCFEEKQIRIDEATEGHLRSAVQGLGRVLVVPMVAGQAFTNECFAPVGPGADLAVALEPGKRAVTIALADYAGLDGLLYPGAQVDVLASFQLPSPSRGSKAISTTLLRGIRVLAVDSQTVGSAPTAQKVSTDSARNLSRRKVTVLVDAGQAEALQLAMEHGTVSLAMRNPTDEGSSEAAGTLLKDGQMQLFAGREPTVAELQQLLADPMPEPEPQATDIPREPAPAVSEAPPIQIPAEPSRWNVTVHRGTKTEVQSIPLVDGADEPPTATGKP